MSKNTITNQIEIPAETACPAITAGLPRLQEILQKQNIKTGGFKELYSIGVRIVQFVAVKELRHHELEVNNG